MAFENFTEFLAMGGYSGYVWSSIGITIALLAWNVVSSVIQFRNLKSQLEIDLGDE